MSFIYQRYSLNDYTGARLAHERNLPFVLEYNGSGIKASHGLGRALKHEALLRKDREGEPESCGFGGDGQPSFEG